MTEIKVADKVWGKNLKDWVEIQEKQGLADYEYVLNLIPGSSLKILDIGCGTGFFCGLALERNMLTTGIDVSLQFIEEAKMQLPGGIFLAGDMENLPFDNKSFDVVCGFNSFQYANDLKNSLIEAKRVLIDKGQLIILTWGPKDSCEIAAFLKNVKYQLQAVSSESRDPFSLSEDDTLEQLLAEIDFDKIQSESIASFWHYPDVEIALKGLLSLGALSGVIEHYGVNKVSEAILQSIEPYKQSDGSVIYKNHYKIVTSIKMLK